MTKQVHYYFAEINYTDHRGIEVKTWHTYVEGTTTNHATSNAYKALAAEFGNGVVGKSVKLTIDLARE